LKQNNETKIAAGFKLYNTVFAVTGPEKDVNWRQELHGLESDPHAALV
jgi:hypothetical protein